MEYFWLTTIALFLLGLFLFKKESVELHKVYKKLATHHNGDIQRGIINYPCLSIPSHDMTIHISAMPHENGTFTHLGYGTNKFSEECVYKIISKSKLPKILEINKNLTKQKLDLEEFDKNFDVYSKNEEYIITLLTNELCEPLLELNKENTFEVRFIENKYRNSTNNEKKFRFDLHIDGVLTKEEKYIQLINITHLFYEQMARIRC